MKTKPALDAVRDYQRALRRAAAALARIRQSPDLDPTACVLLVGSGADLDAAARASRRAEKNQSDAEHERLRAKVHALLAPKSV